MLVLQMDWDEQHMLYLYQQMDKQLVWSMKIRVWSDKMNFAWLKLSYDDKKRFSDLMGSLRQNLSSFDQNLG